MANQLVAFRRLHNMATWCDSRKCWSNLRTREWRQACITVQLQLRGGATQSDNSGYLLFCLSIAGHAHNAGLEATVGGGNGREQGPRHVSTQRKVITLPKVKRQNAKGCVYVRRRHITKNAAAMRLHALTFHFVLSTPRSPVMVVCGRYLSLALNTRLAMVS